MVTVSDGVADGVVDSKRWGCSNRAMHCAAGTLAVGCAGMCGVQDGVQVVLSVQVAVRHASSECQQYMCCLNEQDKGHVWVGGLSHKDINLRHKDINCASICRCTRPASARTRLERTQGWRSSDGSPWSAGACLSASGLRARGGRG